MAKVNLQTNVNATGHIEGQSVTGYLALRVPEQTVDNWSFEVGDELEVVFVATGVTT